MSPTQLCLTSAGCFFLTGLVTGAWKYHHVQRSAEARAPAYVDTAHRASLLYAFACGLLGQLVARSALRPQTNLIAVAVLVFFFGASVLAYVVHGILRDTDNQLARPHRLGARIIAAPLMLAFMVSLAIAEIAAFLTIFAGFLLA